MSKDNHARSQDRPTTPASTFDRFALPRVTAVARMLGYTLQIGTNEAFQGLVKFLRAKLMSDERWWLAWVFLMVCDVDEALGVARAVLPREVFEGPSPLDRLIREAASFAKTASPREREIVARACLDEMSSPERAAMFVDVEMTGAA